MSYSTSVENVLYKNFIKYDRLYALTQEAFHGELKNKEIVIFLDMHSLLRCLYTTPGIMIGNYVAITASMINLCAHLRDYYYTRHGVLTKIFIVWSDNYPKDAVEIVPEYNAHIRMEETSHKQITDLIYSNLPLLEILCPYLYDIFFVQDNNGEETANIIHHLIQDMNSKGADSIPKIVYTKDPFAYQLIAIPKVRVFRPKKNNEGDISYPVMKSNLYDIYRVMDLKAKPYNGRPYSPYLFGLTLAMAGCKTRNLKSIVNIHRATNIIIKGIADNLIYDGPLGGINLNTVQGYSLGVSDEAMLLFYNRWRAIDIFFHASNIGFNNVTWTKGVINMYNPEEIKNINNRYFQDCPLDLNRI